MDPEEYRAALNFIFIYTSEHVTQSCKKLIALKNCISIRQTSKKGAKNKCIICQSPRYGEHCIDKCNCNASQR
jgi:hypothetical protein